MATQQRVLVRWYYGLGEERPWTRRELAREFGMPTARVEDLVNAAVSDLIGMDVGPRFDRVYAACGESYTVTSRAARTPACGPRWVSELKRVAARAHAPARGKHPSVATRVSTGGSRQVSWGGVSHWLAGFVWRISTTLVLAGRPTIVEWRACP